MTKPQNEVPDELLHCGDPEVSPTMSVVWTPPTSNHAGWIGLSDEELRDAAFADGDPHLP